jgi:serine/threonine protein kinase
MAPEQFRGAQADARLDVFALGVMAYELLTGKTPRGSFDAPHRSRSEIPSCISMAVMRALRPEPAERFASITDFMEALHTPRRRIWPWLAGLCVLLGVALWAFDAGPEIEFGPWRDAIAGTRVYEDVISGDWKNEDGILTSNDQICIVKLEDELTESYDVRMRFARLSGIDSVALFFQASGSTGSAELDAWREGLAGVQVIGGEALTEGHGFRFPLENGRTHELLVEVRPGSLRMSMDGELKEEVSLQGRALSVAAPWQWDPAKKPAALAVGSYMASTRFEKVEWRAVKWTRE